MSLVHTMALLAAVPPLCHSLNILILQPAHTKSFVLFQRRLSYSLTSKGHSVAVVSLCVDSYCDAEHRIDGVDMHQIRLPDNGAGGSSGAANYSAQAEHGLLAFGERHAAGERRMWRSVNEAWLRACTRMLYDFELAEVLAGRYDVMLAAPFDYCHAPMAEATARGNGRPRLALSL